MIPASPHQFTTLDGTDMSKVRDCITESTSTALDVRILKVAEWMQSRVAPLYSQSMHMTAFALARNAETLREIAAELRDAATPPAPKTSAAILATFVNANTDRDLSDAWRDAVPTLRLCTTAERLTALEAWITRMCVVSEDDGR